MGDACSPDARVAPEQEPLPPPAQKVLVEMKAEMKNAPATTCDITEIKATRIHRFHGSLRGIGGADGRRYVVPSVVAIGQHHHGLPHLQAMEEVKRAAAMQFCSTTRRSVEEVYGMVFSLAGAARSCYSCGVPNLSDDAELAAIMFRDGCFLLMFMLPQKPPVLGHSVASWPTIVKDILLLENQIPWLVLDALWKLMPGAELAPVMKLSEGWIESVTGVYFLEMKEKKNSPQKKEKKNISPWIRLKRSLGSILLKCRRVPEENNRHGESEPPPRLPHLLALLRFKMTAGMPPRLKEAKQTPNSLLLLSSSAQYLAQIGVKLRASTAKWFPDMIVRKRPVLCELSLSPLFLNEVAATILVNLAALEVAEATEAKSEETDGFVVCSYLSVLAMLMDREEDVQELRRRSLLCSHFSNAQTLAFFKVLVQHLRLGYNYFAIVQQIEKYIRRRPVRIAVHKFVYKNFKIIAAVLSIASVLVGIFKTLFSLKKQY